MNRKQFIRASALGFLAMVLFSTLTAFRGAGGDVYEVWVGKNRLFLEYVLPQEKLNTVSLRDLPAGEQLTVYYTHCGQTGKGRRLVIQNDRGQVLATRNYGDESGRSGLIFPVSEIRNLNKTNGQLHLFYSSKELPRGKCLAKLR